MRKRRTPGLKKECGVWQMQKRVNGKWIRGSTGESDLGRAEQILEREVRRVRDETAHGVTPTITFEEAALRYIREECPAKSLTQAKYAFKDCFPHIAKLPLERVHEGTFAPVKKAWAEEGTAAGTQNRRIGIVMRVLNLCARKWRHGNDQPWLTTAPIIEAVKGTQAKPYPLSWDEQAAMFPLLPEHLRLMCIFDVNTGLRESALCQLQWKWEVQVPELDTSIFICPGSLNDKNDDEEYLVVLNRDARRVIEAVRGQHRKYVFTYRGRPVTRVTNRGWKKAWSDAGLPQDKKWRRGVHNLRHTYGHRLRAAGVPEEDRMDLLWHTTGKMSRHYATPDVKRLLAASESVLKNRQTLLRVVG